MSLSAEMKYNEMLNQKEKREEKHVYINSFIDWDEAVNYIEELKKAYPSDQFEIIECRIAYINYKYRAGISFVKSQYEMEV